MNQEENLYKLLELDETATLEEIKKSYRKLSFKYHPDKNNNNPESTEVFKKINKAYEVLGDKDEKQKYDTKRKNPFLNMMNGASHGMGNMDNLFNMFFNGNNNNSGFKNMNSANVQVFHNGIPVNINNALQKPTPIIKTIEITLEQAFNGCNIPLDIERWVLEDNTKKMESENIYIDIPPGIDNNEIIIVRNKGNIISEQNKGDIKIFIKINNNTQFIRKGLDLYYEKNISLKQSLCGFDFDLQYISGKLFKISNSEGNIIQPNYKKMIPNMGMMRNSHKGNLIIEFKIEYPETIPLDKVKLLKNIL